MRRERLEPLRRSLDELLYRLQIGYARELEEERWPVRFVSHLLAAERRYEKPSGGAPIGEGWARILAAAAALESLAAFPPSGE